MRRTQIYLSEKQGSYLERRAKATGRTMSELIRDAIDSAYLRRKGMDRAAMIRIARATAGSWKEFPESGRRYVERIRGRGRLSALHRDR